MRRDNPRCFRLPVQNVARVHAIAQTRQITFSAALRSALHRGLAELLDYAPTATELADAAKRRPPPMKPQPESRIYFARCGAAIKIGTSSGEVRLRIAQLQTGSPEPLELLASMPGGVKEERALHVRFASTRIHSEWFRATDELLDFIASIAV